MHKASRILSLARVLQQSKSLDVSHPLVSTQWRAFASSSDDERRAEEGGAQTRDAKIPRDKSEYRSWVDELLTAERPAGRQDTASVEETDVETRSSAAARDEVALEAENDGLASEEAGTTSTLTFGEDDASQPAQPASVSQEESAAPAAAPTGGIEAALPPDAAENIAQPLDRDPDPQTSTAQPVPVRVMVRESAGASPDAVVGYQELGLDKGESAGVLSEGTGKINPRRLFWPGTTYSVEDLAGKEQARSGPGSYIRTVELPVKKASNADALRESHFRNLPFLHKFTNEMGQLPPRRVTKLQKKIHVRVMKHIKIARQMALLPPEGKLDELMPDQR